MKELIKSRLTLKTAVLITFAFAFISKTFLFVFPAFFIEFNTVYFNYILTIVVAFVAFKYYNSYKKYSEVILILILMLWYVIISRLNNYIPTPKLFLIMMFTFVAFCIPLIFEGEKNLRVINAIIAVLLSVFSLLALFGIIAYFTRYNFVFGIPATDVSQAFIGLYYEPGDPARAFRLSVLSHPNTTATYYSVMFFLSVYCFIASKSKYFKTFAVISGVLSYLCIVMAVSRTAFLATAAATVVCAASIAFHKIKVKKIIVNIAISLAIGIICGLVLFISFDISEKVFVNIQALTSMPNEDAMIIEDAKEKPPTEVSTVSTNNKTNITNISSTKINTLSSPKIIQLAENETNKVENSLSGRGHIWRGGFEIIRNEPLILLKGYTPLMSVITQYANSFTGLEFSFEHMHSSYIFLLIALGIPGMLIIFAFLIKIVINSFKIVFLKQKTAAPGIYVFPSIVLLLLIVDTMSCDLVSVDNDIFMPIFFLLCGCISFYAKSISWSDFKQINIKNS